MLAISRDRADHRASATTNALFTSIGVQRVIGTTLRICVITTSIALLLGYALAYVIALASPTGAALVAARRAAAAVDLGAGARLRLGDAAAAAGAGEPGAAWASGIIDEPLALVWNEFGIIIGMVHYMVPYAVLPMLAAMREIDPRLLAAARGLGASRFTAFARVFLPLSAPGLIAAGVLVFIFSLGFYITPAILGGGKTLMAAEWIKMQILDLVRWGMGAMLATVVVVAILATLAVFSRVVNLRRLFGGGH